MKQSRIISRSVTGTMLVCFPEKSLLIILFIMELLLLLLEAICLVSNIQCPLRTVNGGNSKKIMYSLAFLLY